MEFNSNKPIFITIKEYYERLIKLGVLKEGTEMPSVREVALANGVNPNTVQRAFSLLVDEGYLTSVPKKGFFVSKMDNNRETVLMDSLNRLMQEGYTKTEIINALVNMGDKEND